MLKPYEALWTRNDVCALVGDVGAFAQFAGFAQDPSTFAPPAELKTLHNALSAFHSIWKRVSFRKRGDRFTHPIAQHASSVVISLFPLIRTLHQLWAPEIRAQISPLWSEAFQLENFKAADLLRDPELAKRQLGAVGTVQSFLAQARESCYFVLGRVLVESSNVWTPNALSTLFSNFVFPNLEHAENRHLALLFRHVVQPMLQYCPLQCFDEASVLAEQILQLAYARLSSYWTGRELRDRERNLRAEIIEEKFVRDLNRDFYEALVLFFGENTRAQHLASPISNTTLVCLLGCVCWNDSVNRKACAFWSSISASLPHEFAVVLLRTALDLISTLPQNEFTGELIGLVRDNYRLEPQRVLSELSLRFGSSLEGMQSFRQAMANEDMQKIALREFLLPFTADAQSKTVVADLPQLPRQERAPSAPVEVNLAALFAEQ